MTGCPDPEKCRAGSFSVTPTGILIATQLVALGWLIWLHLQAPWCHTELWAAWCLA